MDREVKVIKEGFSEYAAKDVMIQFDGFHFRAYADMPVGPAVLIGEPRVDLKVLEKELGMVYAGEQEETKPEESKETEGQKPE